MDDVERVDLDDTSREVIQRCAWPPKLHRVCHIPASPHQLTDLSSPRLRRLVEEKRKLLQAAAPRISLQDYLDKGQSALQQNVDLMRDAAETAPPPVAWGEPAADQQPGLAAAAMAVAAQEGAPWVGKEQASTSGLDGASGPSSRPQQPPPTQQQQPAAPPSSAPSPSLSQPPAPQQPSQLSCAGSASGAPMLHRSSEAAQLRAQRLQQELKRRELAECTFTPKINKREPLGPAAQDAFVERAQQWRDKRDAEQEAKRKQREQQTMEACTFKPTLAPRPPPAADAPAAGAPTAAADADGGAATERASRAEKGVIDRLYQPNARQALEEKERLVREQKRAAEEAECSFKPRTNRPSRNNLATTDVQPRYRTGASPVPQRPKPLPTGAEHCTFSPRVNRVPTRLSREAAEYLDGNVISRLSRHAPASPRADASQLLSSASEGGGRTMRRSASAPRERMTTPRGGDGLEAGGSRAGNPGRSAIPDSFHERQQRFLEQKLLSESARQSAAAAAANQAPTLSRGSRKLSAAQAATPFLQRMADNSEKHKAEQVKSRAGETLPSNEASDCTFAPNITQTAKARRARTAGELSLGDLQKKEAAAEKRRQQKEREAEGYSFRPTINVVPGVESRLKVTSEPESYIARVQQHMRLKDKVTECVRQAEEEKEMRECTFHPQTHDAPAYVTRIAKSMALAKAGRAPAPPEKPGWR